MRRRLSSPLKTATVSCPQPDAGSYCFVYLQFCEIQDLTPHVYIQLF